MQRIQSRGALFTAMKNGATIITPNNRLSSQLLHDFFTQNVVSGQVVTNRVFDKVHCLPYQTFLHDLFKKIRHLYAHKKHPILLSSQQQRHLWQQLLIESQGTCNDGLQNEVQEAWKRCQLWQIDPDEPSFAQTPQTRQFQQWKHQFQQRLDTLQALTEEQLASYVLTYPDIFTHQQHIIWACFDDFTPQQQTLQHTMEAEGCQQTIYDLADKPHIPHHYSAKDSQDEYLSLIEWLKRKLASGESRIAVVVPDLQAQAKSLKRLLQRHISPSEFNISLGEPLSDNPLVAHALHWLRLEKTLRQDYCFIHPTFMALKVNLLHEQRSCKTAAYYKKKRLLLHP